MYKYVELLCKVDINGEVGYDLLVDGNVLCMGSKQAVDVVRCAVSTNATIVESRYLRLKKGRLPERRVITTLIERNGLSYINPQIKVIIDDNKFTGYFLNTEHKDGKDKAYVFNKGRHRISRALFIAQ